jgi:glycogen synthase
MRIAYLAGPANAPEIYRQWSGAERQAYAGTDYMKQFLQLAEELDAECQVITWSGERSVTRLGQFTFINRPITTRGGAGFYLGQLWWHLKLLPALLRFRPDLLVLTGNQGFWWTLAPVRAEFLPSFHCVLWRKFGPPRLAWSFLLHLERRFILQRCRAVVVTSHDIARQVRQMTDAKIIHHLPTYSAEQFAGLAAPRWGSQPFRVAFVSRIEANKGVFDVMEMARRLPSVRFDICGSGGALEQARSNAPDNVTFHGFCDQAKMAGVMGAAHVAIVPTRADCEAGFEMTCAEAILSGRPLITSAVCPALEYLRPATIEVEPDHVEEYVAAIQRLATDRALYERLQTACVPLQAQFLDLGNSWLSAMRRAIDYLPAAIPASLALGRTGSVMALATLATLAGVPSDL